MGHRAFLRAGSIQAFCSQDVHAHGKSACALNLVSAGINGRPLGFRAASLERCMNTLVAPRPLLRASTVEPVCFEKPGRVE
eukprot:3855011-Prymnesium_polylepis.1